MADVAAETDLGDLDDVVPAQVEALQVGRVAESALRQAQMLLSARLSLSSLSRWRKVSGCNCIVMLPDHSEL